MKILWASEVEQNLNDCRLFSDAKFAEKTIREEMEATGDYAYKETQHSGESFSMTFGYYSPIGIDLNVASTWVFRWIEVEEEIDNFHYHPVFEED